MHEPFTARIRHALGRLRRQFKFDVFDVFARHVLPEDRTFHGLPDYEFSLATPDDVRACEEFHTELDERERREGIARLEMGHSCVIAKPRTAGGPVVFSMWINWKNLNIPGHVKRGLQPHQAFIYKAFTSPEHRGRKLYEYGMRFALYQLSQRGRSELLGYAHASKTVSRKGLAAVQFRVIGSFRTCGVGSTQKTFVSRALRDALPQRMTSSRLPADRLLASLQRGK